MRLPCLGRSDTEEGEQPRCPICIRGRAGETPPLHRFPNRKSLRSSDCSNHGTRLRLTRQVKAVGRFDADPDIGIHAQYLLELEGRFRIDGRPPGDDFADKHGRTPAPPSKLRLRQLLGLEAFAEYPIPAARRSQDCSGPLPLPWFPPFSMMADHLLGRGRVTWASSITHPPSGQAVMAGYGHKPAEAKDINRKSTLVVPSSWRIRSGGVIGILAKLRSAVRTASLNLTASAARLSVSLPEGINNALFFIVLSMSAKHVRQV